MFDITGAPIDVAALGDRVRSSECGAVVVFTGIVREFSDDLQPVTSLTYEAHREMAIAEFAAIADEARTLFGPCNVAAVHRTGTLRVGEVAVAVAAASAHRAQAFDACEYVIDQVKARAAIWKKELYADGTSSWRENDCNAQTNPSTA